MEAHILYQGFLHKTPPLDKLFVSWKKRWFVLYQTDPYDSHTVELSYFTDPMKHEKKGSIPVWKIVGIHPSFQKSKENTFAVELKDEKFLLKAADGNQKNIWVAKLRELSSYDQSLHVTVPHQPTTAFCEASLRLVSAKEVCVVCPSTGKMLMGIPFNNIRRFGYEVIYDMHHIIWFETCECSKQHREEFYFFVVNSGMEVACQAIQEIKTKIEHFTGTFLIMEKIDEHQVTYVLRSHYGHKEYNAVSRGRILQSGLGGMMSQTWPISTGSSASFSALRDRRPSEFSVYAHSQVTTDRRNTVMSLLHVRGTSTGKTPSPTTSPTFSPGHSPNPSPSPSASPTHTTGRITLNRMQDYPRMSRNSRSSQGSSSKSDQFDSGVTLDEFDQSRHSAPSYVPMSVSTMGHKRLSKSQPPTSPYASHKPTHHRSAENLLDSSSRDPPPLPSRTPRRITLAQIHSERSISMENSSGRKHSQGTFPSKDSSLGTSADLAVDSQYPYSLASKHESYDHLQSNTYDHLDTAKHTNPVIPPRSLASLRCKHKNLAYVES